MEDDRLEDAGILLDDPAGEGLDGYADTGQIQPPLDNEPSLYQLGKYAIE